LRRINLLPEAARRKAALPGRLQRYRQYVGVGALALGVLIVVAGYLLQSRSLGQLAAKKGRVQSELEELRPVLAAVDTLQQLKSTLVAKMEIVDKLMVGRLLWARKLNELSDLLSSQPALRDNIFLTALKRDSERRTVVQMVPAKGAGRSERMVPKRTSVLVPVLRLEGAVFTPGSEEAIELVGSLQNAIEQDSAFFADFEDVDFEEAEQRDISGKTVWGFELFCEFKPGVVR
jgi:Tfp pilus assembly protein PilN